MRKVGLLLLGLTQWLAPAHAQLINVMTYGAKNDAIWGTSDCSAAVGTTNVSCSSSRTFVAGDVGKTVILDDAKDDGSGNRIPLITKITAVGSSSFTIADAVNFAVPISHITSFAVDAAHLGSGYSFGSTQSLLCSGCTYARPNNSMPATHRGTTATGTPGLLQAVSAVATPANAGGGGPLTTATCSMTVNDEFTLGGQPTQFTATLNGSGGIASVSTTPNGIPALVSSLTSTAAATYNNTTGTYTEGLTGCSGVMGATIYVSYGVAQEQILNNTPGAGLYFSLPSCSDSGMAPASLGVTSTDFGKNLQLYCDTTYQSTTSWGMDNTMAFINALSAMNTASTSANPRCIYVPGGNYMIDALNASGASGTNIAKGYGCWLGDEHYNTNIFVIPKTAGDVFSWLDANRNGAQTNFAATQTFSDIYGSPRPPPTRLAVPSGTSRSLVIALRKSIRMR